MSGPELTRPKGTFVPSEGFPGTHSEPGTCVTRRNLRRSIFGRLEKLLEQTRGGLRVAKMEREWPSVSSEEMGLRVSIAAKSQRDKWFQGLEQGSEI